MQGYAYHCPDTTGHPDDKGLDLHPCCFKLKDTIPYEEGDKTRTLKLHKTTTKKCLKCKSKNAKNEDKGWSYVSSDGDGEICYHVSCFKELIIGKLKEGYFS